MYPMYIFPYLFSVSTTNSDQITYEGLRNVLAGYNNNYLKHVADSEERTLRYINNVLEERSKQETERHIKLLETIGGIIKSNEPKDSKNDSLLKILPFLKAFKGQGSDDALLSLLSNKKGNDNLPLLLHFMNKQGSSQLPTNLLLPLLTGNGQDTGSESVIRNYLLVQLLTEQQDQNTCKIPTSSVNAYGPSPNTNSYGPSLNPISFVQPPPTYGPTLNAVPREVPVCPQAQESCPNQGIETREYGRNYGRRP